MRKPHGLKGDVAVFPLTDTPEEIFTPGRCLDLVDVAGTVVGGPVVVERCRSYHREWLVKFEGLDSRTALDQMPALRGVFVAASVDELSEPDEGETYYHELVGFAVTFEDGSPAGIVSEYYELPSGVTLEIQGAKREFLVPFVKEFVGPIDREARQLVIRPPEGLIED